MKMKLRLMFLAFLTVFSLTACNTNDTDAPTITADTEISFIVGTTEPDWSSYVTISDGTLTIDDSQVDMNTVGSFDVEFTAEDDAGNITTHTLNVIIESDDTDAPTITGDTETSFIVGDSEPDWSTYVTLSDGTLSIDDSQVDMSTVGTFDVVFTAEDTAGNTATHTLLVTIEAEDMTLSLIDDGVFWLDTDYAYAMSRGDNPLAAVEYDKGDLGYPKLVKEINQDLTDYNKLSISVSGIYYIMISIVSDIGAGVEVDESYYISLMDEPEYYEIDLDEGNIIKDSVIRVEIIATPGAEKHHGHFEVDQLFFSENDLTVDALTNDIPTQEVNTYTSGDTFDFNMNWYDRSHTYVVEGNDVTYSRLPNTDTDLSSKVSGDFSDFDFINFVLSGEQGTNVYITLESSNFASDDLLPEVMVQLTDTPTQYTLFIDQLSAQARAAITSINLVVEPDSLIATTGTITIESAEFSNETTVERPVPTVNTYLGGGTAFDFNNYWYTVNSMTATFDENTDEAETVVDFTKQFVNSAIRVNLDGAFSDFSYINIAIEGEANQEFFIETTMEWGYRLNHYVTADEDGLVEVTVIFALQYFDWTLDELTELTITPSPNQVDDTGTFTITTAEFSNTALVDYTLEQAISFDDIVQVGDDITIDSTQNTLSWSVQDTLNPVFVRVYGNIVPSESFLYPKLKFDATVSEDMLIQLEVDGAFYDVNLTPSQTTYEITLANPTSGLASTWKFSGGFNLFFHLDPTVDGNLVLENIQFFDPNDVPEEPVEDMINVKDTVSGFQGLGGTITVDGTDQVVAFTKSAFNSLFYFTTSGNVLGTDKLSNYTYFNLYLESTDVTEALVELSGYSNMTYYTTFENDMMKLTIVLKPVMLDSQIDALDYINITPMPNSDSATGTIRVVEAYFSNEALVDYTTDTFVSGSEFHEIGSIFTITDNLISWDAGSGYKTLMTRMHGSYADDTALLYPEIELTATVTEEITITIDINGTWYNVTLIPSQTVYTIDLTSPDSGNADLWKFQAGFNLQLMIDTATAGSIDLTSLEFTTGS